VPPAAAAGACELAVDASAIDRRLLRARLVLPVSAGTLALAYPKWIPGEHGPTGPIARLTGLRILAAGQALPWRRDPEDVFLFRCEVPAPATSIEVTLDYLVPSASPTFSAGASTAALAVLSWNTVLLLPRATRPQDCLCAASLRRPAGWRLASALTVLAEDELEVRFRAVPVSVLVDSPVLLGRHLHTLRVPVAGGPPHELAVAADGAAAVAPLRRFAARITRVVEQAGALFGWWPCDRYCWLLALSEHVAHYGLEHGASSDNRMPEDSFAKERLRRDLAALLCHEYLHVWNGGARRPVGLLEGDFQRPVDGSLLWVYEGLTQYLGCLIAVRSGLWTAAHLRAHLALLAARMDHQAGRRWRPLADTAVAAQLLYEAGEDGQSWRRGTDFYDEGLLVWLEIDTLLRRRSDGRASLDDFCLRFFGEQARARSGRAYDLPDLVGSLAEIAPFAWEDLLAERLHSTGERAPLGGIAGCGYRLIYRDRPNPALLDRQDRLEMWDWTFSAGLQVRRDARVRDVVPGLPADLGGIVPGMRLLAVSGREWSPGRFEQALREAQASSAPLDLMAAHAGEVRHCRIDHPGGVRHPHLERDDEHPDLLAEILRPLRSRPRTAEARDDPP
jgi:predicted metalloprotease with PDZ domain